MKFITIITEKIKVCMLTIEACQELIDEYNEGYDNGEDYNDDFREKFEGFNEYQLREKIAEENLKINTYRDALAAYKLCNGNK